VIRETNQKSKQLKPKEDQVIYADAVYTRDDLKKHGIGDETIIQMVASKEVVPCNNVGHGLRYFGDEIIAWMKKNRQRTPKRTHQQRIKVSSEDSKS
jgi:hypothetical protein